MKSRRAPIGRIVAVAVVLLAAVSVGSCAPEPRSQACMTDDVCKESMGETAYCFRHHCVECVSHASCPDGERCVKGHCER